MSPAAAPADLLDSATFRGDLPPEVLRSLTEQRAIRAWSNKEQLGFWALEASEVQEAPPSCA